MRIQETHDSLPTAARGRVQQQTTTASRGRAGEREHPAPALRTDARRNLRHVLDAARDVFGEQGYDAPIEEVARRARVGVGTVYRRFPNKDALVQFIAEQETQRLTDRALEALTGGEEPWAALEGFVRFSAEAGTGRLLPQLFATSAAQLHTNGTAAPAAGPAEAAAAQPGTPSASAEAAASGATAPAATASAATASAAGPPMPRTAGAAGPAAHPGGAAGPVTRPGLPGRHGDHGRPGELLPRQRPVPEAAEPDPGPRLPSETRELLAVLGRLVDRAREAGRLRADVTVADVLLVIATAPPLLTDPARQAVASDRLLNILLNGLRPHP